MGDKFFLPRAYLLTSNVTGKQYVGITIRSLAARWKRHCQDARAGSSTALHRAIRKHGETSFEVREVANFCDLLAAKDGEVKLIAQHQTLAPHGYNLTRGGDGAWGYRHSEETKALLARMKTENNWMKGRRHTPETRARMSEGQRLVVRSPLRVAQQRALAVSLGAANLGRRHSPEACARMAESRKRPVLQLSPEGRVLRTFPSAVDAEAATGVKRQHIYRCCRGKRRKSGGFCWQYAGGPECPE